MTGLAKDRDITMYRFLAYQGKSDHLAEQQLLVWLFATMQGDKERNVTSLYWLLIRTVTSYLFYCTGVSDAEATELNQELLGSFMTESSAVLCCGGAVCGRKTLNENIFKD